MFFQHTFQYGKEINVHRKKKKKRFYFNVYSRIRVGMWTLDPQINFGIYFITASQSLRMQN